MKKILMIFTMLLSGLILSGCIDSDSEDVTAPSFVGISIDSTNPHNGSDLVTFYKERSETITVEVTINNPDNLDIRSIVIDGYYYYHTRFTSDSTSEVITFDIEAQDVLGEHVYSVDDINYFDGSNVLTTLVKENNLFEVYVFKDAPNVRRDSFEVTANSIELGLDVTDNDDVIVEGSLIAEIWNGDTKLDQSFTLVEGLQTITFTGLDSDKHYDVKVRVNYDLNNEDGLIENYPIYNAGFLTYKNGLPKAVLGDPDVSSTGVSFDVEIDDSDDVLVTGGLTIVLINETLPELSDRVFTIDDAITFFEITDLLNDNEYTIQVIADYDLRDGLNTQEGLVLSEKTFTTGSKEVPEPVIDNLLIEQNRISFDLSIDDPEGIIDPETLIAELWIEGMDVPYSTHEIDNYTAEFQIFNILSGFEFTIVIKGTYDLNNGSDPVPNAELLSTILNTEENGVPEIIIYEKTVIQGYVILDLQVVDNNTTLKGLVEVILLEDGLQVGDPYYISAEATQVVFAHDISYLSNYSVEFAAEYDLRDGLGIRDKEVLKKVVLPSFEPLPPAAEIKNIATEKEGFTFDVVVLDADSTIIADSVKVRLEKDGEEPIEFDMNDVGTLNFDIASLLELTDFDILSNNTYKVLVIADYNVNRDTENVIEEDIQRDQVLYETFITTDPKVLPTTVISNPVITDETVTVDVFIEDIDDVVIPGTMYAGLFKNGVQIGESELLTVGSNNAILFDHEDILSDNSYDVFVYTDYNLNDGYNNVIKFELGSYQVRTEMKVAPSAIIQNLEATTDTISMDVIVSDPDDVITGNTKVVLYIGEEPYELENGDPYEIALVKGLNPTITFTDVYSDQSFNIRVVTDYNLNDGTNAVLDELLDYDFVKTSGNDLPTGEMFNVTVGIDSISFNTIVDDDDSVITDGLQAIIYLNGNPYQTIDVEVGIDDTNTFTGLPSDSDYTIRLVTNYNLRDIAQEQTDYQLDIYTTSTNAYTAPTGYVTALTKTTDTLDFSVMVDDPDATSVDDYVVQLFRNGVYVNGSDQVLNEGLNLDIHYGDLDSGVEYQIKIVATYNLLDGYGDITSEVYSRTEETIAKKLPEGVAENLVVTNELATFTFNYTDEDGVVDTNTDLVAKLYIPTSETPIAVADLTTDEVTFDISGFIADFDFTIIIECEVDLSDGNPSVTYKCLDIDLTTPANQFPQVIISNISINQNDTTAIIDIDDVDSVITGNLQAVIKDPLGNTVATTVNPLAVGLNEVTFPGNLDHNTLYRVQVIADYNMKDSTGPQSGVLKESQKMVFNELLPEAHYYNVVVTDETISFHVTIYDQDNTFVDNAKAVLLEDGVPIETFPLDLPFTSVTFTSDLISDYDYEVAFLIDYDNDNGNGTTVNYEMNSALFHVEAKEVPTATVTEEVITSSRIDFDVAIINNDSVIQGDVQACLTNPNTTDAPVCQTLAGDGTYFFDDLKSNTSYDIEIIADYDLEDLSDVVEDAVLVSKTNKTLENSHPEAVISDVNINSTIITFDVDLTDGDSVVDEDNLFAVLYINGLPEGSTIELDIQAYNDLSFTGLKSNTIYTVSIEADYDLNDGINNFDDEVLVNATVTTDTNDIPTAIITYIDTDFDSLTFNANVVIDPDIIITNLKAVLYKDGLPAGKEIELDPGLNSNKTFSNILSNETYEVKIVVDYDLDDGFGVNADYELTNLSDTTAAKQAPNAIVDEIVITNQAIQFDVEVLDVASTIQDSLEAVLYKDGVATGDTAPLVVGENTVTFNGLAIGKEYEIKVQANYNNNIGNPDELFELTTFTESTRDIVVIDGITNLPLEVYVDIIVDDFFDVLTDGYVEVVIYDKDSLEVADSYTINVSTPTNTITIDILNYYNNHDYSILFQANIDDGLGGSKLETVQELDISTLKKQLQSISLDPIGVNGSQVATGVSIVLPDEDYKLITGTVYARLYEWDPILETYGTHVAEVEVINGDNTIVFSPFDGTDGTMYLVTIEANCDWNEADLGTVWQILDQRTFVYTDQN